jgi:AraC family transcriptional activator of pobA
MKRAEHFSPRRQPALMPFTIKTINHLFTDDKEAADETTRSNSYYTIIWILKGAGQYRVDMETGAIDPNRILCIKPGQSYQLGFSAPAEGFAISFTEAFLNAGEFDIDFTNQTSLLQLFAQTDRIAVSDELKADMKDLVDRMIREYDNLYLYKMAILKRFLKIFLIYLTRQLTEDVEIVIQSRNRELVQKFTTLLEQHFKVNKMVSDYARYLCVTPSYLNEIIKKITGYSASYHIRQRIVLEAKRKALYSDVSMKEVAYELGFLDTAHFSKFFKSIVGNNFSEFKKEKVTIAMAV